MKRMILTAGLLALAAAGPATGATLTFTDRGNWTAQVTSLLNFDGGTQAVGTSANVANGGLFSTNLQVNGFNIDLSTVLNLIRANAGAGQNYYNWGTGTIIRTADKTPTNAPFARISFPSAVSAFGFSYGVGGCEVFSTGCFPGAAGSLTISPGGMASIAINTVASPNFNFWGVVSDTQTFTFADIYVNDTNRYLVLDDISQGVYSTTPPPSEIAEPGTLLQLAMGAALLVLAKRKFSGAQTETT